jgi:ABC-2 type transport system ATP-binding protein
MIRFEAIMKLYPNGRGLKDIDLSFGPGVHGVVGRNGAGKTTALKLIMGLLSPDSGRVFVGGRDIAAEGDGHSYRRSIGYFPADDYFFPFLSGRRNLEYLGYLRCGDKKAYATCAAAAEATQELEIESYLDEPFALYSSGMRKKAQLVGSLVGEPDILIWDEPNNGVDIMANIYIRDLLERKRKEGKTVLLSSHVLEFMSGLLDSVAVLDEGRVAVREEPVTSDLQTLFLSAIGRGEA